MTDYIGIPKFGREIKPGDVIRKYSLGNVYYPCFVLKVMNHPNRSVIVITLTASGLQRILYWEDQVVLMYASNY